LSLASRRADQLVESGRTHRDDRLRPDDFAGGVPKPDEGQAAPGDVTERVEILIALSAESSSAGIAPSLSRTSRF